MASRRQIAIAALGGALAGCAPAPPPPPSRHVETMSLDEPPYEEACGGDEPGEPSPTPEERGILAVSAVEKAARLRCDWDDKSVNRYGEIRLELRRGDGIEPSITSTRSGSLAEGDRRCVEDAARAVVAREDILVADFARDPAIIIALGNWPPLLPAAERLTPQWLAARRSKPAARRLARRLPAVLTLGSDGCISMPVRQPFNEHVDGWLAAQTPFHDFWQGEATEALMERSPGGGQNARAYWLTDQAALLYRQFAGDLPRHELCLVPFDGALKRELRARIDRRGTCWAGDLDDILLNPRTEFPSGRRFKTVAAGPTRACAIGDRGVPVCCGERPAGEPPAGAMSAIAVGTDFDCGIAEGGDLLCWGSAPPAGGGVIAGPFQQVAVAGPEVCAIRSDARALECWRGDDLQMVRMARDAVRDAAVSREGVCGRLEDGRIFCRGSSRDDTWRELHGPFQAHAASAVNVCGVTAAKPARLRCWRNRDGWPEIPESDLPLFATTEEAREVALSGIDGCVLARSGRVACWPTARKRFDGLYRMIAGGGEGRFCALTVDGRVECDRPWPHPDRWQP